MKGIRRSGYLEALFVRVVTWQSKALEIGKNRCHREGVYVQSNDDALREEYVHTATFGRIEVTPCDIETPVESQRLCKFAPPVRLWPTSV